MLSNTNCYVFTLLAFKSKKTLNIYLFLEQISFGKGLTKKQNTNNKKPKQTNNNDTLYS